MEIGEAFYLKKKANIRPTYSGIHYPKSMKCKRNCVVKNLSKKYLDNILEQCVKKPMTGDKSLKKANGEKRDGI